ncbi:hypothetical protein THAOC_03759 [Thalassiosira oceanica]|uniref:Uncharacterized protein n=1 Tax=Thalassiosira oceanica TaxID=159749 RepID=K0TKG0_THAOC|nr:hypothetical protein THAOC_03759 [Thalassiosira oceanica]|eukprot:EJK74556.1 hypothetical protein THAOC_03759 [Thalassiosira oceanica]
MLIHMMEGDPAIQQGAQLDPAAELKTASPCVGGAGSSSWPEEHHAHPVEEAKLKVPALCNVGVHTLQQEGEDSVQEPPMAGRRGEGKKRFDRASAAHAYHPQQTSVADAHSSAGPFIITLTFPKHNPPPMWSDLEYGMLRETAVTSSNGTKLRGYAQTIASNHATPASDEDKRPIDRYDYDTKRKPHVFPMSKGVS